MKTTTLLALSLAAALPLSAQTTAPKPTVHVATVHAKPSFSGCITVPPVSPKIPALPPDAPCVKSLYTLTAVPTTKLDYVSPLVNPAIKESLEPAGGTFSLLYVDTKVGTGDAIKPKQWLTVHYTGYLVDGTKFDSSLDRNEPISFPYGQGRVIPGWDTGFEGMHIGGKRRLYIPYELAYGEKGRPPVIPAKAELIFDMELISQSDEQPKPAPKPAPPAPPTPPAEAKPAAATPPPASATPPPTAGGAAPSPSSMPGMKTPPADTKPATPPPPPADKPKQ
jgi:peptidylprolyl isomerase